MTHVYPGFSRVIARQNLAASINNRICADVDAAFSRQNVPKGSTWYGDRRPPCHAFIAKLSIMRFGSARLATKKSIVNRTLLP
jgi:hypothetical protein